MRSLYAAPDLDPRNVCYLETHGTGTTAGDPVEARAIGEVFRELRPQGAPLLVGSVKSNIGHLEPASGLAGLLKTLLVLQKGAVPPNLHLTALNKDIDADTLGLRIPTDGLPPLPATPGPRLAGVSSFGFGGANAHIVLEQAPAVPPDQEIEPEAPADQPLPPLLLSAHSPASLAALASAWAGRLEGIDRASYSRLAGRTALCRDHLSHRLVLSEPDLDHLCRDLRDVAAGRAPEPGQPGRIDGEVLGGRPRLAFVFSGNGGPWPGMRRSSHLGKLVVVAEEPTPAVRAPEAGHLPALRPDAAYLVTGGLGGLGLTVAKRLAQAGARHLVLAGRSGAATAIAQATVAELAAGGVRVDVVAVDLADCTRAKAVLAPYLAGGATPLAGLVHCAGILRDATIANLTPADITAVLRAKAVSAYHLHWLTRDLPLDFFVLFSSATTVMEPGNPFSCENALVLRQGDALAGLLLAYPAELHRPPDILRRVVSGRKLRHIAGLLEGACPDSLYINTLWLDASYRGTGLADDLLQCARMLASEQGLTSLSLNVWADNSRALRFYQRHGSTIHRNLGCIRVHLFLTKFPHCENHK